MWHWNISWVLTLHYSNSFKTELAKLNNLGLFLQRFLWLQPGMQGTRIFQEIAKMFGLFAGSVCVCVCVCDVTWTVMSWLCSCREQAPVHVFAFSIFTSFDNLQVKSIPLHSDSSGPQILSLILIHFHVEFDGILHLKKNPHSYT